ncbi:hypothetical protein AALP_AAs63887U000200 [Arabis alpina]|uniref:Uncharacterized protein n=1 Tax=Arabis alpina TaxID=50452 RepID=A0A087FWC0_ARAAL|nr:hypothetical protein AALP_AAs63887U000200 [Arabis alpina]
MLLTLETSSAICRSSSALVEKIIVQPRYVSLSPPPGFAPPMNHPSCKAIYFLGVVTKRLTSIALLPKPPDLLLSATCASPPEPPLDSFPDPPDPPPPPDPPDPLLNSVHRPPSLHSPNHHYEVADPPDPFLLSLIDPTNHHSINVGPLHDLRWR